MLSAGALGKRNYITKSTIKKSDFFMLFFYSRFFSTLLLKYVRILNNVSIKTKFKVIFLEELNLKIHVLEQLLR